MATPKARAFVLTYLSISILVSLRMCYSFNKTRIKDTFHLTQFHLGILDACLYISYSIGVLSRYQIFQGQTKMTHVYFINAMMVSIFLGVIGYLSLYMDFFVNYQSDITTLIKILLTLAMMGYGFFHMAIFQINGAIVSQYYDSKKESSMMGFWGSDSSFGNIVGLLFSNFIVFKLQLKWQTTIFIFTIINLLFAFAAYFYLQIPEQDQFYKLQLFQFQHEQNIIINQNSSVDQNSVANQTQSASYQSKQQIANFLKGKEIRLIHLIHFAKKILSNNIEARFLYIKYFSLKATVYTFWLWFPTFLVSKNLAHVSGYIAMLFDVGGILGSFLVGRLQGKIFELGQSNFQQNIFKKHIIKYRSIFILTTALILIVLLIKLKQSIVVYSLLAFFIGITLQGSFHVISGHDLFILGQQHLLYTDMLLNISTGVGAFVVGMVQLMNAVILKNISSQKKQGQHANYGVVFIVLLIFTFLAIVFTYIKILYQDRKIQNNKQKVFLQLKQQN